MYYLDYSRRSRKTLTNVGLLALMDLSKAYDCLSRNLMIAKLEAYGLDIASLSVPKNYLADRKKGLKLNSLRGTGSESYVEFLKALY